MFPALSEKGSRSIAEAVLGVLLLAVYFASRLINLTLLPLFVDEGVYLWWGTSLLQGDLLRGFGQGKPLSGWLIALTLALGVEETIAPRLAHVIVGGVTLISIVLLARRYLSKTVALVAAMLWTLLPCSMFFGRLAAPDVALAATGMLTVCLSARMFDDSERQGDWPLAIATGASIVAAMLAKMPVSAFFAVSPLVAMITLQPVREWRKRLRQLAVCYSLPGVFLGLATFTIVARKWLGFTQLGFGLHELSTKGVLGRDDPALIEIVMRNTKLLISWAGIYLTWPLAGALLLAWWGAWFSRQRVLRTLALLGGLYVCTFAIASAVLRPRYLFAALPPLVVVLALGLLEAAKRLADVVGGWVHRIRHKAASRALCGLVIALMLVCTLPLDWSILYEPQEAALPEVDRQQYIEGMGSGYGLREAATYLAQTLPRDEGEAQVIMFHVSDCQRLSAYASAELAPMLRQVHVVDRRSNNAGEQVDIFRSWLSDAAQTYVLVGYPSGAALLWHESFPRTKLVKSFPRPRRKSSVELYYLGTAATLQNQTLDATANE